MGIKETMYDSKIKAFILTNNNNMMVKILNYGGIINSIILPNGADVVLGFDTIEEYPANNSKFFGAAIGRIANRIENAKFNLNGKEYILEANNGKNSLHGGSNGLHCQYFNSEIKDNTLVLSHTIKHLEDCFPGNLNIEIHHTLTDDNSLIIEYFAKSDEDTIVNLTNHSYFNLNGGSSSVLDNILQINAEEFTFNNSECIPTGEILSVKGTPLDFTTPKAIGENIFDDDINIKNGNGYDHNFIVNNKKEMKLISTATGSKCTMETYTDCPCVQLFSGNNISTHSGKHNMTYGNHYAFCLETGLYPNAINLENFPTTILKANEEYNYKTIYKFI